MAVWVHVRVVAMAAMLWAALGRGNVSGPGASHDEVRQSALHLTVPKKERRRIVHDVVTLVDAQQTHREA